MNKKMLFVVNCFAGKGKSKEVADDLEEVFEKNDFDVFRYNTVSKNKTILYVEKNANKYDLIVCCGGDGTLNETISGLMKLEKRPPLGYIPQGTTNDFASSIGISKNPHECAVDIINSNVEDIDIGKMGENFFTYIVAFGAFTEVSYTTSQEIKNIWGRMAYFLEGISRLSAIKSYKVKIEYDENVVEDDFIFGAVTNSTSVAGFKSYDATQMKFDDGLFEGLFVKMPKTLIELNNAIIAMTMRDFSNKCFVSFSSKNVKISSDEKIAWTVDGEFGGEHEVVNVENFEKAIQIYIKQQ